MPSFQLARFPINPDGDSMAQEMLDSFDRHVDKRDIPRPDRTLKGIYRMHAGHYAMRADYYFTDAPRAGIEVSLRSITKWLPTAYGNIIPDSNIENLMPDWTVYWNIDACYRLRKICLDCPHAMIVLYHAIESKNQLLRGEILTILETMRSRLALSQFKYHIVIPVLIISVINEQGRIIQAQSNGQEVTICMSQLHDLNTKDMAPYDLLNRYMASQPVGDTKFRILKWEKRSTLHEVNGNGREK